MWIPRRSRFLSAADEHRFGDLGEIERLPLFDASLAGRQGEECVDEPFLLLAELRAPPRRLARKVSALGVGVGEGDLE